MGTQNESYYPRHASIPLSDIPGACGICKGSQRLGDDYCRACAGTGYRLHSTNQMEQEVALLAESLAAAAAELEVLRVAAARALAALRGVMPYFARLPPETEQHVRRAVASLLEVARG